MSFLYTRILRAVAVWMTLALGATGALQTGIAHADVLLRTFRVAPPGVDPNGPSGTPSLAGNGRYVAFASLATNLGPAVGNKRTSNVYLFDFLSGKATLISAGLNAAPANGPSTTPSVSANGQVVAFASQATNLVAGTPRKVTDVFVKRGTGPVVLLSAAFGGLQPDGESSQPVVSADGRFVAFTSSADDLIAGDDNARSDVFVANLVAGGITRVSVTSGGGQANGDSYNPSISGDGRLISFTSGASNLVSGDHNHVPDVFVHDQATGKTTRVSVSSSGRQQNASVAPPFGQVSNLSADGHYVVFDSDATNLVSAATSGHTNVFRHSLVDGHTALVSRTALGRTGTNDSFSPATSADGRVTVFESFADNLASPWTPSENVFAQDLLTSTMLTPDVTPDGGPRGPELDAQLLQQPAVSADGQVVAFTSGANNLVAGDYNGTDDLFVRVLTPPSTRFVQAPGLITTDRRPLVQFTGSTALATFGYCELDGQRLACPVGTPFHLPTLGRGSHVLKAFTGAPGTLFDSQGAEAHFTEL